MKRKAKSIIPLIVAIALVAFAFGWRLPIPDILPSDSPIPVAGLHVMIVEETGDRRQLPSSQVAIFTSVKLREWLDEHSEGWRIIDASGNDIAGDEQKWQDAFARQRASLPWMIVSNHPKGGKEIPLPETVDQTIRELEAWK